MEKISRVVQVEKDIKYATRFMRPILTSVGAWPIPDHCPLFSRIVQKITHAFTYFVFFLLLVPTLHYVIKKETNNKIRLKLVAPIINCGLQAIKYTIILYRMKEMQKGLDTIRQDWTNATEENRLIFLGKAKIARRIMLAVTSTIYGAGICYRIVLPLLRGTIVTPDNFTIRPLPCPVYFAYLDEQQTPIYEILFFLQIMGGFASYAVVSGSCGISAFLVLHACSMLRILGNKIKLLTDKGHMTEKEIRWKIANIVEFQMEGKKFLKSIQEIIEFICLSEVLGCTCLICLVEYCILMEWENKNTTSMVVYMTFTICFTFCAFVLCYIGQLLLDESNVVSQTSRTIDWHRLQPKQARSLILIIAMSNYPLKLTGGKVVAMSLTTFTDVIKLSLGYMNMLRQVV
ncbi:odorant receptor 82a-like isoform X2 [Ceratina calcarata]|uniref:Odorant receptor n=1 Tax=Ceratina calcarata TaxID=156304 RepID=A0AAJ7IWG6_9HYME|nr:odorant receptor 82a-like isoform X2 [Ceratina calcarata]